jgi:hypothetical protein
MPALLQGHAHRQLRAFAFGMGRGHVVGIARQAIADHFGIDLGAAGFRVLVFFEHDNACALAHHKTVAVLIIWTAGFSGWSFMRHVERACACANPATPSGLIVDSAPPASMMSASPSLIIRAASPIECAPVEQAVTTEWFGPISPYLIEHLAAGQVDQAAVNEVRADPTGTPFRPGPDAFQLSIPGRPPMPEPIDTPVRVLRSSSMPVRPASSKACPAASIA